MDLMALWTTQAIFIISASIFSFIASTTIVIMIIWAEVPGTRRSEPTPALKSSPYHRIIFGLSVSDMFQSLALLLGPFLAPEQVYQAFWSVGNNTSCAIDGLFLTIGAVGTPLYTLFLCYYSMRSMSRVENRRALEPAVEKMCHGVIVVFTLILAIVSLSTKALNTYPSGLFCSVAATPTGCRQFPELFGECDERVAGYVKDLVLVGFLLVPLFSLLGIIVCVWRIYRYVIFVRPRVFQGSADANVASRLREKNKPSIPSGKGSVDSIPDKTTSDVDVESETTTVDGSSSVREYRKQILIQASLYILVYLVTYILVLGLSISNVFFKVKPTIYWNFVTAIFYPMGGFLNIVVYTRPKVVSLRMKHPELSILRAFGMVVRAGSAVPMVVINRGSDSLNAGSHPSSRITPPVDLGCRLSSDGVMNNRSESESETKPAYQFYPRAVEQAKAMKAGAEISPEKESKDLLIESTDSFRMSFSHDLIDTIMEEEGEQGNHGSDDVESAS